MPLPAARLYDIHNCPHGPGAVNGPGCPRVLIGNNPAARKTDLASCPQGASAVVDGNPTVLIGGKPAARATDRTAHGGRILHGIPRVHIGNPALDENGNVLAIPPACAYLGNLKRQDTMEAPEADFKRHASPTHVGPGTSITYTFPGDSRPSPAMLYPVDVRGKRVLVVAPQNGADKNLPSVQQVADGLGGLSDEQLAQTNKVVLSPNRNPDDAHWEKAYNMPGFSSAAVAGGHTITFFPNSNGGNANVDSTIIHEAGHLYAQELWKDPAKKEAWRAAMGADGRSPSMYADASIDEDFAESCVMYALSKGTPCEATARRMYPNRYKELDRLFPRGFPQTGVHP